MAFRQPAIEAMSGMTVDTSLVQRWIKAVAEFHGRSEDRCREILTIDAATTLQEMCSLAVKEELRIFTCFYG